MSFSKKYLNCFFESLRDIFIFLMKQACFYRFYYTNLKIDFDIESQKTTSKLIFIKISLSIQLDSFTCRSILRTKNLASLPSEKMNYKLINLHLQSSSKITIAKFTTSTRINVKLQAGMKKWWATTICSTFKPECQYDKKNYFEPIGIV